MIELSLTDVQNIHKIIQQSINRGTFNADELSGIIRVYEGLTKIIIEKQNQPAPEPEPEVPTVSDSEADAIIKS